MLTQHIFHGLAFFLLVTCLAVQILNVAEARSCNDDNLVDILKDNDFLQHINSDEISSESREYIYSVLSRRALRKILNQMPCGWPEYGIPPLAPYQSENFEFDLSNNWTDTQISMQGLLIEGLNDLDLDKLEVSYTFNKLVEFDLNFRNITASGKIKAKTSTNLAALLGIDLNVRITGDLNLSLEDLRFTGSFKYKLPIFWGSARINDFRVNMTLGNVRSQLKGTLNGLPITSIINKSIERILVKTVNNNQMLISVALEQLVEPFVNVQLLGKKLWNVLEWSLKLYQTDECVTEPSNYTGHEIISNGIY